MIINAVWINSDWQECEKEYVPEEFDLIINYTQWVDFLTSYHRKPFINAPEALDKIMLEHAIAELLVCRGSGFSTEGQTIFRFTSLNDAIMFKMKL